ncbi:glycosyltransferase family 2 protein [Salipiger mangrovisoli]|uniref:Glycosyltransferase family 2 protein n=1 Tax=Salipiger mangrovisoli TaxID=2865933 RepID=A0ABR9X7U0_9RHOB|nr:glycosyltransferase family 2 protein [Salipiger mangrovisoli]MBE9639612.1 glycosyltransferase family 2 protein [Salipiger mangrovisoli]
MTQPLVSVVMPCYNSEKHLAEAINSILSQSYKNIEFIILNDGSKDSTAEIIRSFAAEDPRIRFHDLEKNGGLINASNTLLQLAKGEYIARMDSDDISQPDRISRQVEYMQANPHKVACGTAVEQFGNGEDIRIARKSDDNEVLLFMSVRNCPLWNPSSMIRRSVVSQNNLRYDKNYPVAEDSKFWFDVSMFGELGNLPEPLVRYRRSETQLSRSQTSQMKESADKLRMDIFKYILARYQIDLRAVGDTLEKIPKSKDAMYSFLKFITLTYPSASKITKIKLILASTLDPKRKMKLTAQALKA